MLIFSSCMFALGSATAGATPTVSPSPAASVSPVNLPQQPDAYAAQKQRAAAGPNIPATRVAPGGSTRAPAPASVTLSNDFAGLNRSQAGNWDPPDTNVAAGSSNVLEAVNEDLRITTQSGAFIADSSTSTFWTVDLGTGNTFDTKVFHDNNSARPRYYIVSLEFTGRNTPNVTADDQSRVLFAVSRSSDPTGFGSSDWCQYSYDGARLSGQAKTWADYPGIGFGSDAFAITTNQFTFPNPSETFQFSTVAWVRKNVVNNNASSCPAFSSLGFGETNALGFTLQPGQQYSDSSSFTNVTNPVYFVSSTSSGGNSYVVWRLANVATATPSFVGLATVSTTSYSMPPNPPGGASGSIDAGDARILQVAARGDVLGAVHTTGCQFTNGTSTEDCFRYAKLTVTATGASVTEQLTEGAGDNNYFNFPSIAVDTSGRIGIAVQTEYANSSWFLGGAVITRKEGDTFNIAQLDTGTCALAGAVNEVGAQRSGDFSGAQTTPDGSHFWVAIEAAHMLSGSCGWSTTVANPK
jgi:hypothetical protein